MSDHKRDDGILLHWKSLLACLVVSMCQFQFGLDSTLIGGFQAMPGFLEVFGYRDPLSPIGYNISTVRQQLISSLMTLGAFITSASAGLITNIIGRKTALWIGCILCLIGDIIMMTTSNIGALYFGRFIMGVSNALFSVFGLLYIQECAPAKYRGAMIGISTYWITFGALIGNIIDNFTVPLGGKRSYVIPLGVILIMPGIIAVGLLFIPESPRWLLQKNRPEKAQTALKRLRPHQEVIDQELANMAVGIDTEAEFSRSVGFIDLWRDPTERRRALLAIGAICIQPASGATYVIIYSTYFFEMAGIGSPFEDTCIMAGIGSFVLIVNSLIITKYGRRRVFLGWGMTFCGLSQLIMAAVYTAHPNTTLTGKIIVGCTIVYLTFYNGTISTYSYLCGGEFPSQNFRTYTFGIATSVAYVLGWLITFTAPYFINPNSLNWGPKYGYIWAGSCFIGALWVWLYLPEVKNRTFEEIDEMFKAGLPARKFRKYECSNSAASTATEEKSKVVHVTTTKEVESSY